MQEICHTTTCKRLGVLETNDQGKHLFGNLFAGGRPQSRDGRYSNVGVVIAQRPYYGLCHSFVTVKDQHAHDGYFDQGICIVFDPSSFHFVANGTECKFVRRFTQEFANSPWAIGSVASACSTQPTIIVMANMS